MELMFYLDYVYHLVKNQKHLKKPIVKVTVYLTGLGKRTGIFFLLKFFNFRDNLIISLLIDDDNNINYRSRIYGCSNIVFIKCFK